LSDDSSSSSKIAGATEPIAWTDDYRLGVADIDQHHQVLFERVNAFFAAARSTDPQRALKEAIGSLRTDAANHFAEEEKYMERIGYPGRDGHGAAHRVLMRHFEGVVSLLSAGGSSVSAIVASAGLLRGWLLDHIVDEDGAVGAYARSRPESQP
jgi:hemerythrin-like metal-binding protein